MGGSGSNRGARNLMHGWPVHASAPLVINCIKVKLSETDARREAELTGWRAYRCRLCGAWHRASRPSEVNRRQRHARRT